MHTLLCKTEKRPSSVVPLITKIHSGKVSTIFLPKMAFIFFLNKHRCRVLPGFLKRITQHKYFLITNMMCLFGRCLGILKFLGVSQHLSGYLWVVGQFLKIPSFLRLGCCLIYSQMNILSKHCLSTHWSGQYSLWSCKSTRLVIFILWH